MTPKEKAEQLFNLFDYNVNGYDGMECWDDDIAILNKKQCALIVVDEIEKALTDYGRGGSFQLQNMDSEFRYWQQVKEEIEKL